MATKITSWKPGKLYQPGDVVIRNEGGAVSQVLPGNPGFESGDTLWTKGTGWTIDGADFFQGAWSAVYAGEGGSILGIISADGDGAGSEATYTTTDGASFVTTFAPFKGERQIANDSLIVACNIDTADERAYNSTDGVTFNLSTTIPWDLFEDDVVSLLWDENTSLFFAFGGTTDYWTTPDGDTWTLRSLPTSDAFQALYAVGSTTYGITFGGRVYSTTDGISWSTVTTSIGQGVDDSVLVGSTVYVIESSTSNVNLRSASTSDLSSWTQLSTGETSLESVLGGAVLNNGVKMAQNGGTFVVQAVFTANGAQTDHLATATDPNGTWTARSTEGGASLRYSSTLSKFVTTSGGPSSTAAYLGSSADGITWVYTQYDSSDGFSGNTWDLSADDPINDIVNDSVAAVNPGQTVRARCVVKSSANGTGRVGIRWYDVASLEISTDYGNIVSGASTGWRESSVEGVAPTDAVWCGVVGRAQGAGSIRMDNFVWEYFAQVGVCSFTFEATQAAAAYSGTAEPTWPLVLGNTVVDNAVTWTARQANCITYEAKPILLSDATEPTWPTEVDASVADNTIRWIADDQRVKDENCPNTKEVAIAASKIFAADDDIVAFSATVNPLDWTTVDDSGFIPFGLNTYGSQPITALALYRSNLCVFNSKAFQMWQVDEDPANMAILDAVPVGCPYFKSPQPVSNDLVFLTEAGIRSMGIAGASTNLQAGFFGKQVDPLVLAAIKGGEVPNALYYPGAGQYWLFFGEEAFVLTMNGGKQDMSWSRYVFPSAITDWTIESQTLLLRSGDKIWEVDEDTLIDDSGGANVTFDGEVWWPYLDFGAIGVNKMMIGFDTVATGEYDVVFGYDQTNDANATTSYTITSGDNLYGDMIPMPLAGPSFQMRLTFTGATAWEWSASTLYLQDWRRTS